MGARNFHGTAQSILSWSFFCPFLIYLNLSSAWHFEVKMSQANAAWLVNSEHLPYLSFLFWVMRSQIVALMQEARAHSNRLPHKKKIRGALSQVFFITLFIVLVIINFNWRFYLMLNVGYQKWNHKIVTFTEASGKVPKKLAKNFEFMIHKSFWINGHQIFHLNVYCKLIQWIVSHNDILLY